MATTPQAVSAVLRRAGFLPVSGANYIREGIRVTGRRGRVRVLADWDTCKSHEQSQQAEQVLVSAGYIVERTSEDAFYVSKEN